MAFDGNVSNHYALWDCDTVYSHWPLPGLYNFTCSLLAVPRAIRFLLCSAYAMRENVVVAKTMDLSD